MELVELDNGACEVHNILASLLERVESHEESVCRDLPLVGALGLALVLEVGVLELGAGLKSESQLVVSFFRLFVLDAGEDGLAVDVLSALVDDSVADLSDQDYKTSGRVVVWRVGPDHEDHVHNRHE